MLYADFRRHAVYFYPEKDIPLSSELLLYGKICDGEIFRPCTAVVGRLHLKQLCLLFIFITLINNNEDEAFKIQSIEKEHCQNYNQQQLIKVGLIQQFYRIIKNNRLEKFFITDVKDGATNPAHQLTTFIFTDRRLQKIKSHQREELTSSSIECDIDKFVEHLAIQYPKFIG